MAEYDKDKDVKEWLEREGKKDWRNTPQARYKARVNRQIKIDFLTTTEQDMLDWLDKQPAKATYIKRLIREDMAKQKTE